MPVCCISWGSDTSHAWNTPIHITLDSTGSPTAGFSTTKQYGIDRAFPQTGYSNTPNSGLHLCALVSLTEASLTGITLPGIPDFGHRLATVPCTWSRRGTGPGCGRAGGACSLRSFHQLLHSHPTCPWLCPPSESHLLAICTDMCRACVHESLAGEILGDLFLSHTYIPCVQADGGGVYVSVLFCKGEKI